MSLQIFFLNVFGCSQAIEIAWCEDCCSTFGSFLNTPFCVAKSHYLFCSNSRHTFLPDLSHISPFTSLDLVLFLSSGCQMSDLLYNYTLYWSLSCNVSSYFDHRKSIAFLAPKWEFKKVSFIKQYVGRWGSMGKFLWQIKMEKLHKKVKTKFKKQFVCCVKFLVL